MSEGGSLRMSRGYLNSAAAELSIRSPNSGEPELGAGPGPTRRVFTV